MIDLLILISFAWKICLHASDGSRIREGYLRWWKEAYTRKCRTIQGRGNVKKQIARKLYVEVLLVDKYTQADSSQISLVQVDLEKIKYTIQPTFLDQIEMQVYR